MPTEKDPVKGDRTYFLADGGQVLVTWTPDGIRETYTPATSPQLDRTKTVADAAREGYAGT